MPSTKRRAPGAGLNRTQQLMSRLKKATEGMKRKPTESAGTFMGRKQGARAVALRKHKEAVRAAEVTSRNQPSGTGRTLKSYLPKKKSKPKRTPGGRRVRKEQKI